MPMTVSFLKILSISYNFDLLIILTQNYGGRKWKVHNYAIPCNIMHDYAMFCNVLQRKKAAKRPPTETKTLNSKQLFQFRYDYSNLMRRIHIADLLAYLALEWRDPILRRAPADAPASGKGVNGHGWIFHIFHTYIIGSL